MNTTGAQRADIQGLRGVAVLLVVLYHAGLPLLPGGYIGVDVFFVISGYLITGLLVREFEDSGRIDFPQFIARRARRLLPAAVVLLLAVAAAAIIVFPAVERIDILDAARASAVYAANLWFALRATDYLGGEASLNPMLHMWSLAIEEQFYLVWPFLVWFAARFLPCGSVRTRTLVMVAIVSAVSYLACRRMTWMSQPWAFFGTPFRAWEFGLGAIVHLSAVWLGRLPKPWGRVAGLTGVAAVAAAATQLNDQSAFPGSLALLPAGGTALVLAALLAEGRGPLAAALSWRPLTRVGDLSYSWYLWHWPFLVVGPVLFPAGGAAVAASAVVLSYLAAEASYRFVEQPFRTGRASRWAPQAVVASAVGAACTSAFALTVLTPASSGAPGNALQQRFIEAKQDIPTLYKRGCHVPIRATAPVTCEAGDLAAQRTIVLFGDSHAAHWYPALEELAAREHWKLVSITKSGCPWVSADVDIDLGRFRRPYHECPVWREAALKRIVELRPSLVVVANSSRHDVPAAVWEAGARKSLAALQGTGTAIALMRDTPWPGFNVPTCLARAEHRGAALESSCSFDRDDGLRPGLSLFEAERQAVANLPGATVIDLSKQLCPTERCATYGGTTVHFSDHSHLTASYSRQLAPALGAALHLSSGNQP